MAPRRRLATALALAAALLGGPTGCELFTGPQVDLVEVTPSDLTVRRGETVNFTAVPKTDNGGPLPNRTPTVSVEDPTIATVTFSGTSGQVLANKVGTTRIIAESNGKRAEIRVTVTEQLPAAVRCDPPALTLRVGDAVRPSCTAIDRFNQTLPGVSLSFSSSNPAVVDVSSNGTLTARATGQAQVTASAGSATAIGAVSVTVTLRPIATLAIQLSGTEPLRAGERRQLVVTARDSASRDLSIVGRNISYSSSDVTVATVDNAGVVTALRAGTVRITATVNEPGVSQNVAASVDLTVGGATAAQVSITPRRADVRLGGTFQFGAGALDSTGQLIRNVTIEYRSTNPTALIVSPLGTATGRARAENVLVIASYGGKSDTAIVRVTDIPRGVIELSPSQLTVQEQSTTRFTATVFDSVGTRLTNAPVTWLSENPLIATVDPSTGEITTLAPGTVRILAQTPRVDGLPERIAQTAQLIITPIPVATIQVPGAVTLARGSQQLVNVIPTSANGTVLYNRQVNVVSSNPAVASAAYNPANNTAVVSAFSAGTTTITFTAASAAGQPQGTPASITITVNDR